MPELKKWDGDRSLGVRFNPDTYAYKDRKREKLRLEQLQHRADGTYSGPSKAKYDEGAKKGEKRAWSHKLEARDERERRREKKRTRREAEKWAKMTPAEKEKQRELDRMIERVKSEQAEEEQMGDFEGFDD